MAPVPTDLSEVLAFFLEDAPLQALIDFRLHPLVLPQAPLLPAITFQVIGEQREMTYGGPVGIARWQVQFSCWARTYDEMHSVADALRLRLNGFKGEAGEGEIAGAFFLNSFERFEPDTGLYGRSVRYAIWLAEED